MLRQKSETYRGYQIAAAPGTHQAIVDLVVDHLPRDAQLLDLGSYKGAMLRRLRDAGYRNLAGADLVNRLTDEPASFFQCDFNDAFAQSFGGNKYACIIASEVIEHVDDPRHFLKQCRALLKPEGVIIVSTPNIAFFEGRIKFFLTGELWGFGRKNYLGQRHITPISTEQFPIIFAECGYTLVSMTTAGSFATGFRKLITSPLWLCMRAAFGKFTLGRVSLGRLHDRRADRIFELLFQVAQALLGVAVGLWLRRVGIHDQVELAR